MTAYLYTWDPGAKKWTIRDITDTEEQARELGRLLWRSGVSGIKIDVVKTTVEERR